MTGVLAFVGVAALIIVAPRVARLVRDVANVIRVLGWEHKRLEDEAATARQQLRHMKDQLEVTNARLVEMIRRSDAWETQYFHAQREIAELKQRPSGAVPEKSPELSPQRQGR